MVALQNSYRGDIARIVAGAEARCRIMEERPDIREIVRQSLLRGADNSLSTFRREKTSVRKLLALRLENGIWPQGVSLPLAAERATDDEVRAAMEIAETRPAEARQWAIAGIAAYIKELRADGREESDEDLEKELTGHAPVARQSRAQGRHQQALLRKDGGGRTTPFPGRTYPTASVTGMPSAV